MSAAKLPRGRRGGIATVVALVVLAACTLATIAALQIHAGRDTTVLGKVSVVAERLRTHTWTNVAVLVTAVVCAVLGVLLLLAGLLPARRPLVRLTDFDAHTIAGIDRAGLARDLRAVAGSVDGVASAKVAVRRGRVVVRATSALRDRSGVHDAVRSTIAERLEALGPARALAVRVRVAGGGS